jgi:hypothetical protein
MGVAAVFGCGTNFCVFVGFGMMTGLGNLPLLPRLHRLPDIMVQLVLLCFWLLCVSLVVP